MVLCEEFRLVFFAGLLGISQFVLEKTQPVYCLEQVSPKVNKANLPIVGQSKEVSDALTCVVEEFLARLNLFFFLVVRPSPLSIICGRDLMDHRLFRQEISSASYLLDFVEQLSLDAI